ncbi:MAG: DMT family transporter [Firmicutes bacterium]|jgi:drug/metabolite transporter (DMT)-like permease|nr:DMT family transporter [Bacillota bacterium]
MAEELMAETAVSRKKMILADVALVLAALFWGANFVVAKAALDLIPPFTYLGLRFIIAAVLLAAACWRKMLKATRQDLLAGLLAGFFLWAGFAFQTVGLLYTTPAKSGFITGISVVLVPFLYILVTRKSPGWFSFAGGSLALVGLFLLSGASLQPQLGDALTFICAIGFAAHIVALGVFAPRQDPVVLTIVQMALTGAGSMVLALLFEPLSGMFSHPPLVWGAILFAVLFCTIGAFLIQNMAQRFTPPTHAALILSTEAVFAGIFSFLFWSESFTIPKLAGALLIFAGIVLTELKPVLVAGSARRYEA